MSVRLLARPREPGMQLQIGKLPQPEQRRQIVAKDVLAISLVLLRVRGDRFDELRGRGVLDATLIERAVLDSIRKSSKSDRAIDQVEKQDARNRGQIDQQVALGERAAIRIRPHRLVEV